MPPVLTSPLLTARDPDPVQVMNAQSQSPILLLCEHAGQAVPAALNRLGLDQATLNSHRGWDIGARDLARGLARRLGAPLVMQRYSRLVIDCNRPPDAPQAITPISDGTEIPGNLHLCAQARAQRVQEIFQPMDDAIERAFMVPRRACFSIHSFTPCFGGHQRPWHGGFLTRATPDTGRALMAAVGARRPDLNLALNEPYQIEDQTDWFIPRHAERRQLPHCLIEIRNDQIDHEQGVAVWVDLLAQAIDEFMETLA